jgi:hypothetical protein
MPAKCLLCGSTRHIKSVGQDYTFAAVAVDGAVGINK